MSAKNNRKKKNSYNPLANLKSIKEKTGNKVQSRKWTVKNVEEFKRNKNNQIIFSFKFYDRVHKAFNLGGIDHVCKHWFIELLDCLKEVSNRTWGQLSVTPQFRAHDHNFSQTNFKYELFDEETLEQLECVQFAISKSYGRVHGFLIDNCFYIYWLDPHHNMNDSKGYGRVKEYSPGKSCYELLNEHNLYLTNENERLNKKIETIKQNKSNDEYELLEELISMEEELETLKKEKEKLLDQMTERGTG